MRLSPRGELLEGPGPDAVAVNSADRLTVWLERDGAAQSNDAIILERLALML